MHTDPITLLVAFKDGCKVGEADITDLTAKQVAHEILIQEKQGRTWGYSFTSREKMKKEREKLTDFHLKVLRDEASLGI